MGKKEKKIWALQEEFQAMINLVPKLKELLKMNKEIAEGYQKYRKTGGASIPGLEKHLGIKEPEKAAAVKIEKTVSIKETKKPKDIKVPKKSKTKKTNVNLKSIDPIKDAGPVT